MPHLNKAIVASAFLFAFACKREAAPTTPPPPQKRSPLSQAELATTDATIALGNLGSSIHGAETILERGSNLQAIQQVAGLLLLRAQLLARVSDYERATALAERAVTEFPNDGSAYLLRARARAALHRFDDASSDLEEASRRGAAKSTIDEVRAGVERATGHVKDAVERLRLQDQKNADAWSMGALAGAIGELGDVTAAEELFAEAQHHTRDVSPFPIVWLYLQQGLMWQRAGDVDRALELFAAAVERVPQYVPAVSHLAAALSVKGKKDEAIKLLEPLAAAASSEDPECAGQLALLYEETGKKDEAQRLHQVVDARYDRLLAAHPEAYADHGARFWLNGSGSDLKKALAAAEKNADARRTEESYELALTVALAAKDSAKACALADRALARDPTGAAPPRGLLPLAALAYEACGKPEQASALRATEAR